MEKIQREYATEHPEVTQQEYKGGSSSKGRQCSNSESSQMEGQIMVGETYGDDAGASLSQGTTEIWKGDVVEQIQNLEVVPIAAYDPTVEDSSECVNALEG